MNIEELKSQMREHNRILMVEDDPEHVRLLQLAFEEAGLKIPLDVVTDGRMALSFLDRRGEFTDAVWPTLVLLDLNMAGMDGWEVLRNIRNRNLKFPLPVIIFSSTEDKEQILKVYSLGANSFIRKPMGFDGWIHVAKTLSQYWFNVAQIPGSQGGLQHRG